MSSQGALVPVFISDRKQTRVLSNPHVSATWKVKKLLPSGSHQGSHLWAHLYSLELVAEPEVSTIEGGQAVGLGFGLRAPSAWMCSE